MLQERKSRKYPFCTVAAEGSFFAPPDNTLHFFEAHHLQAMSEEVPFDARYSQSESSTYKPRVGQRVGLEQQVGPPHNSLDVFVDCTASAVGIEIVDE